MSGWQVSSSSKSSLRAPSPPENEKRFVQRLEKLTLVNFPFETNGTHVRVRGCARAQKVARRDKFAESF